MTTGYTCIIEAGDGCTFEEYVWRCAHAFGACIMLRESSMDVLVTEESVVDTSTYYVDEIAKSKARLAELETMTLEQAEAMAQADYDAVVAYCEKKTAKEMELTRRYAAIREAVEAWSPPTPDHAGMKAFMLQQIQISTEYSYTPEPPMLLPGMVWLANQRAEANERLAYNEEHKAKQDARNRERVEWVRTLAASVPPPVPKVATP